MRALIFDCDGVLAETERDGHRVAFNQLFAELGLPLTWGVTDYAEKLQIAGGRERLLSICTDSFVRANGLPAERSQLEALVAGWHRRKTELFLDLVESGRIAPREGVRRLAETAHADGWQLAVASTSAEASVRAIVGRAFGDVAAEAVAVIAGDMVPRKKPAPDVYLRALVELDASAAEGVAVEDSQIGVAAARAAGLPVLATISYYTGDEDLSDASIVVDRLGEPGGSPLRVRHNGTATPVLDHIGVEHLRACRLEAAR